jgi:intracellular sulfur oxidation DsrE/DsrF family protein
MNIFSNMTITVLYTGTMLQKLHNKLQQNTKKIQKLVQQKIQICMFAIAFLIC